MRTPIIAASRINLFSDAVLGGVGWLYLLFAYAIVELRVPNVTLCPFALLTGSRCPLCGSTRFIGELLHGNVELGMHDGFRIVWFLVVLVVASAASWRLILNEHD